MDIFSISSALRRAIRSSATCAEFPRREAGVEQLIRDADTPVSFSPDATQLVYTRGYPRRKISEVRVANVDGTGDHLLATVAGNEVFDSGPTWSPKNDSIAVSAHLTGQRVVSLCISFHCRRQPRLNCTVLRARLDARCGSRAGGNLLSP